MSSMETTSNINSLSLFNSLSFLSPLIITTGVIVFSIMTNSIGKALFYIIVLIFFTMCRIFIIYLTRRNKGFPMPDPKDICNTGNFLPFENNTYSIFVLCFTFMYFAFPMFVTNNVNFQVLIFFLAYIVFDILTKFSNKCIGPSNINGFIGDLIGGLLIGAGFTSLLFYFYKNLLFMNEIPSNKEVCSMPSKQTFKCVVYKNGEVISSTNV